MLRPKQVNETRHLLLEYSFHTRKGMRISTHSRETATDFPISPNKPKYFPTKHLRTLRETKPSTYLCNSPVDYVRNYDIFTAN
ncbi:hypothetical protein FHW36_102406 [Chitinophaga polysaccharea]|uniref:Uncharacterized protein n=1 Tax=Chitinophaga polysaccharea TaxID=1293035 RepID=A0A561PX21_9BACT|nr:hypothetical protein FHW36_102406 [Chitinophaga polysaccharea]